MRQRLTSATAILLLLSAGLGCSLLRPKRPVTWHVTLEVDPSATDREAAVRQTVAIIESRLNAFGVSRFEVRPQGDATQGRIIVSLPDVPDRERIKKMITAGGKLELTAVVTPPSPAPVQTYNSREEAIASMAAPGGTIPANRRLLPYTERDEPRGLNNTPEYSQQPAKWLVVESPPIVDGSELRNATAVPSRTGIQDYYIVFSLKRAGAEKFGTWTGSHINSYLGVVLNDEVKSVAFIKSQIFDQGEISGRFTKQSAEDIARVLNSGALPVPVKIVEEGVTKNQATAPQR